MAAPQTQVNRAREAVRAFMLGLAGMNEMRQTLVDLGAPAFIGYLDETDDQDPPQPIYDISSADVVAALVGALDAINAALSANDNEHREALRKLQ